MKIKDIMSKELASSKSDDTVEHAAQLMKKYDIGSVPVCQNDKLVGIITDRDIAVRSAASGQNPEQQKVSDVMSKVPIVGNSEMDVHSAAKIMSDNQIRRLYIVDSGHLSGVVALGDISVKPTLEDNAGEALKNISMPNNAARM